MNISIIEKQKIDISLPVLAKLEDKYQLKINESQAFFMPGLSLAEEIAKFSDLFGLKNLVINLELDLQSYTKLIFELADHLWGWDKFKSGKHKQINVVLAVDGQLIAQLEDKLTILRNLNYCKELAITPPNLMTPKLFSQECSKLSKLENIKVEILDQNRLAQIGMNCVLAVGKGSINPPFVVKIEYCGNGDEKPLVLIGKGVCFDAGGLFIKDQKSMPAMKYDKSGACAVLAAIKAAAELKLPVNVIGIIGLAENMPGGNAMKPGDIIRSLDGATIEIADPDAEGRLILADCIAYSRQFNPSTIITLATLTADTAKSIGVEYAGVFSENNKLLANLLNASHISGDKLWHLPMGEPYKESTKSNVADLKNVTDSEYADNCTAATFLQVFAKDTPFAHIDLSLAVSKPDAKLSYALNPTGFGVRLLCNLLQSSFIAM